MSDPLWTSSFSEDDQQHLGDLLRAGRVGCVSISSSAAQAYVAWGLWQTFQRPIVWVVDGSNSLDRFYHDLLSLQPADQVTPSFFPARETLPGRDETLNPEVIGDRLATLLKHVHGGPSPVVATSVQALMQRTIAREELRRRSRTMKAGEAYAFEDLPIEWEETGYHIAPLVQGKGEAAIRGGLLDIWPLDAGYPYRMEFFGSTLESIRTFDPLTQRSQNKLDEITIPPAAETPGGSSGTFLDYVNKDTCWIWADPLEIEHHASLFADLSDGALTYSDLRSRTSIAPCSSIEVAATSLDLPSSYHLDLVDLDGVAHLSGRGMEPDALEQQRRAFVEQLIERTNEQWSVHAFFSTEGTRDRFAELYADLMSKKTFHIHVSPLSAGFTYRSLKLCVVTEAELFGYRKERFGRYEQKARRRGASRLATARVEAWNDIQPGDLVVHIEQGIGKYLGLYEIVVHGRQQEVLAIEYAERAKLYVPVTSAHLLSRYVGVGSKAPALHKLGGKRWLNEKDAAEIAVQDLAAALLETQARRDVLKGHAFPQDTTWQHEFENAFPFEETPDQITAIEDIKRDMEQVRPMDRLVCGDVGYGKTEVAMRAAFKAVMDGKQVAMLVPTTILAQQHFDTFINRFAQFPFTIEILSRFQTRGEQKKTVERVAAGQVDVVIGTHRLLQDDIRFKDLGLVIIDEEQRFGVAQKEYLKHLRELVDILTMTATPIPRTLYMSLTGAKDMSTIQTPPQERMPIETIVTHESDEIVRTAILRELNREGQVFYLHNRVKSIGGVMKRLSKTVPEARIAVAHGQMAEDELSSVMRDFIDGKFDVLLCTTIIESGVDIPNVNTILIDRADRFGMADLYQLRGRVGRYKHQAYAYLLLPKRGPLVDMARKRIHAFRKYGSLGAGFRLALKDLELRGAGNILGSAQSGHIVAVGFHLYCQLLKRAVAQMKDDPLPRIIDVEIEMDFIDYAPRSDDEERTAVIPASYVEDESLRLSMYRELASTSRADEIDALRNSWMDRFGQVPSQVEHLLALGRLRILASERSLTRIEVRDRKIMMYRGPQLIKNGSRFPRTEKERTRERIDEVIRTVESLGEDAAT